MMPKYGSSQWERMLSVNSSGKLTEYQPWHRLIVSRKLPETQQVSIFLPYVIPMNAFLISGIQRAICNIHTHIQSCKCQRRSKTIQSYEAPMGKTLRTKKERWFEICFYPNGIYRSREIMVFVLSDSQARGDRNQSLACIR